MKGKKTFGILGGGLMGIDLASRLTKAGFNVTILEAASGIGGLTGSAKFGNYIWDRFYHVILPDDQNTIGLIRDLSLSADLVWKETKTGFFIENTYHSMSDIFEFLTFPALNLFDKFRLGLTILAGTYSRNYKRLEEVPVSQWLIRWSGKRTFTKIWLPLLKAKLGESYKLASAAFICSTIKRLYGARKDGNKKEMFGYVKGGYSAINTRIAERLTSEGINVVTGFKVKKIELVNEEQLIVESQDGTSLRFDWVVSTLPSAINTAICPALKAYEKEKSNNIKYLGVICLSVLTRKPLTPYYVTNITDERVPFTGVIEMTALVDPASFGGNSLVYLPKYLDSDDKQFSMSDKEIRDLFLSGLRIMQPELKDEDILDSIVSRARYVIALPEIGYSRKLPSFFTSLKNFFVINSAFITDGTLNVNETLKVSAKYFPMLLKRIENEE